MSDLLARYSSVSVQLSTISVRVGQTVESLITSLLQRVHPISTVFQYLSDRLVESFITSLLQRFGA